MSDEAIETRSMTSRGGRNRGQSSGPSRSLSPSRNVSRARAAGAASSQTAPALPTPAPSAPTTLPEPARATFQSPAPSLPLLAQTGPWSTPGLGPVMPFSTLATHDPAATTPAPAEPVAPSTPPVPSLPPSPSPSAVQNMMLEFFESLESRITTRFEALEARVLQTDARQGATGSPNPAPDLSRANPVNATANNPPTPVSRPAQSFAAATTGSAGPARAPEGFSTSSSRMTQPPTAAVSSMIAAREEVLVGEVGLVPIHSQDPEYSRLLDYRRYRLAPSKMSYDANVQPEKVKGRFPLTLQCVQGGPFDGNGEEPSKPLAGSVLTFLKILSMEANASNLTEGDVRAAFTSLVGPKVGAALLQEGLTVGTKVTSTLR